MPYSRRQGAAKYETCLEQLKDRDVRDVTCIPYLSIAVMVAYHALFLRTVFNGKRNLALDLYTGAVYVSYYKALAGQSVFVVSLGLHIVFFVLGLLLSRRWALLVFFPFNLLPAYLAAPDTAYGISHTFAESLEATGLACGCFLLLYGSAAVVRRLAAGPEKPNSDLDALAGLELPWREKMRLRLAIIESGYGRAEGWQVLAGGEPAALLTDCTFAEMFWDSYKVEPVNGNDRVFTPEFWLDQPLEFINARFGLAAKYAFPAGRAMRADDCPKNRIWMRGLYLVIPDPSFPERLILFWRRLKRRARPGAGQ